MQLLLPLRFLIIPTLSEPDTSARLSSTMPKRVWTYEKSRIYSANFRCRSNDKNTEVG